MRIKFFAVILALLVNTVMGASIGYAAGFSPEWCIVAMNVVGFSLSFVPMPSGLRVGVYTEVWTGKLVEHFTHAEEGSFLDGVPDFSQYAENDVIHLVDMQGDPTVLIDNTTYPLQIENLGQEDVAIKLHKFETRPTRITDDELHAISFDKIKAVKDRHGNRLSESRLDKAIHAFAPVEDTENTPVVFTSGSADEEMMRVRLVRKDILTLKNRLDKLKIPKKGRRLVLCSDHINDLLDADQKFKDQYYNYESGSIGKMYGFDVYEYSACPLFAQDRKKVSFGAVPAAGQFEASVFFYVPRMAKVNGTTKMYYSDAKTDPVNKQNLVSFTNRFVAIPQKREKSTGAIVSKTYTQPAGA